MATMQVRHQAEPRSRTGGSPGLSAALSFACEVTSGNSIRSIDHCLLRYDDVQSGNSLFFCYEALFLQPEEAQSTFHRNGGDKTGHRPGTTLRTVIFRIPTVRNTNLFNN
jgi:hypothetical protein